MPSVDCALASAINSKGNGPIAEGIEMVNKKLFSILEKEGLVRIEAVGQRFDPNKHEACMKVITGDLEEGMIAEEIRPGYMFKGQVIRPSMVKVNSSN